MNAQTLGDPQDRFNINIDLKRSSFTLGYSFRWVGPQYLNLYEDYNSEMVSLRRARTMRSSQSIL